MERALRAHVVLQLEEVQVEEQVPLVEGYKQQYRDIRGEDMTGMKSEVYYFGHMPTPASKIHRPGKK